MSPIKLALVLSDLGREHPETAIGRARALGLRLTGRGRATLSFETDAETAHLLFPHARFVERREAPPGPGDFGAPGGPEALGDLPVPEHLAAYVRSVSVTPPARRLDH